MPAGDWAQAGRVSSQRFNNAMQAVANNSVDPNKLIKESMIARSEKKKTAMKASEAIKRTEDKAETLLRETELNIEVAEAQMDARKMSRKAGMLAAGAGMLATTLTQKPERKMPKPIYDNSGYQTVIDTQQKSIDRLKGELDGLTVPTLPDYSSYLNNSGSLEQTGGGTPKAADPSSSTPSTLKVKTGTGTGTGLVESMGFSPKEFNIFKTQVSGIESGGKYNIAGGSNNHFDGKYQLGATAKTDAARQLGIQDPGHSPSARESFRTNPQLQEQMFEGFTKANHSYLMRFPEYANANNQRKLELLGYAHNQGMGNAGKYLKSGVTGYDGFGTAGTAYIDAVRSGFSNQ